MAGVSEECLGRPGGPKAAVHSIGILDLWRADKKQHEPPVAVKGSQYGILSTQNTTLEENSKSAMTFAGARDSDNGKTGLTFADCRLHERGKSRNAVTSACHMQMLV